MARRSVGACSLSEPDYRCLAMTTSCSGTTCTVPSSVTFTMRQRATCPSGRSTKISSPGRHPGSSSSTARCLHACYGVAGQLPRHEGGDVHSELEVICRHRNRTSLSHNAVTASADRKLEPAMSDVDQDPPVAGPGQESEDRTLLIAGLDHSWKWVEICTNRQAQSFNFFLVLSAFLVAAYISAIGSRLLVAGLVAAAAGVWPLSVSAYRIVGLQGILMLASAR